MDGMSGTPQLNLAPPADTEDKDDTKAREEEAEIVHRAQECYRIGIDASATWRKEALTDLEFLAGEQWDANSKGIREQQKRPALTVNRLPQFVRQVTNEQRQSKPAITVNPVDSGSDIRTAEVFQGAIRNVEYTSNADAAYASGGQSAAITGLGYWDVRAEWEDEKSFDQKLTIARIPNPMSVVMDPGAKEVAGDDARWVIISTDMSKSAWDAAFPGKDMPTSTGWKGEGDSAADWVGKEGVRLHEYRYITEKEDVLVNTTHGPLFASEVDEAPEEIKHHLKLEVAHQLSSGAQTRKTTRRKACWAKIAGDEVVERGELAGHYLQLVRVVGTELEIDGKKIYEGVIRHARDTQRMLNFFVSAEAEAIALSPKAPWLMAEGQDEGHETEWKNANTQALSTLVYKPTSINGQPVAPPQRVMAEANVSAITNARMQAADDLKAVTGIYDAALGARSNEQSGRAILARQSQGQTANFHFQDNLGMAIRYTGRILIDLIPIIYSGPRVLRILGEDGKHEMVPVNGAQAPEGYKGDPTELIDLNAGRYDVAVSMGPSYQSRRQEAAAQMLELIRVNPMVSQIAGDLLVESMDLPNGKAIADRIRKTLPPDIRPPDEQEDSSPEVMAQKLQQASQQLQQSQQMIQQLTQAVHAAHDALDSKTEDNEAKERIEMAKLHTSIVMKLADIELQKAAPYLKAEAAAISQRLNLTGFKEPVDEQTPPQGATNGIG